MNDQKSWLSEKTVKKSARTYSRKSQLDFSFFQPVWWNMKLWQDVVGKLKESREQKKGKKWFETDWWKRKDCTWIL